jgi:hypothetical protein
MQLYANVLLIVAGVLLIGNAAISFVAASWVRQVQDNWWLGPLANRWGVTRVRVFLILNGALTGTAGIAAIAVGAHSLLMQS